MLQLRARMPQLKTLRAATKTQCSQVNIKKKNHSTLSAVWRVDGRRAHAEAKRLVGEKMVAAWTRVVVY